MFAQLVITILLVWMFAEILCRVLLRDSTVGVVRSLVASLTLKVTPEPSADDLTNGDSGPSLDQVIRRRRLKLARTRSRVELTRRAADLAEDLRQSEEDLLAEESRLAADRAATEGGGEPVRHHHVAEGGDLLLHGRQRRG